MENAPAKAAREMFSIGMAYAWKLSCKQKFMGRSQIIIAGLMAGILLPAQTPNPTQQAPEQIEPTPIFRIEVVARTTPAVNYLHRGGSTRIDFQGTPLMPAAKGSAKVESQRGVIHVSAEFKDIGQPTSTGRST